MTRLPGDSYCRIGLSFINDINHFVDKQYGFFRGFMDYGIDKDSIVNLAQFMINNKVFDFRNLGDDEEIEEKFLKEFSNEISIIDLYENNKDGYSFFIPLDLIENLQSIVEQNVTLVGGARKECLEEVSILLSVLNIIN